MTYRTNVMVPDPRPRELTDYECDCIIAECCAPEFVTHAVEPLRKLIVAHHNEPWSDASIRAMAIQVRARWFRWRRRALVREAFRHARGARK